MNSQMLGDLEKEIMEFMWTKNQPVTVRIVYESISKKRKIAYTTAMTIMGRLVDKGLLKRKESGKAYIYQPTYSKDKFLTRISRQIIKNFIANFGDVAIAHFAQEVDKLVPVKRQELLKILKGTKK